MFDLWLVAEHKQRLLSTAPRGSNLNLQDAYSQACEEVQMYVPFDLKIVSMVIVLMLIVLFAGLWMFHFWIDRHEEHLFKHGPQDTLPRE